MIWTILWIALPIVAIAVGVAFYLGPGGYRDPGDFFFPAFITAILGAIAIVVLAASTMIFTSNRVSEPIPLRALGSAQSTGVTMFLGSGGSSDEAVLHYMTGDGYDAPIRMHTVKAKHATVRYTSDGDQPHFIQECTVAVLQGPCAFSRTTFWVPEGSVTDVINIDLPGR